MWLLKSCIQVYEKDDRNNFKLGFVLQFGSLVVSPVANETLKAEDLHLYSKHIRLCLFLNKL